MRSVSPSVLSCLPPCTPLCVRDPTTLFLLHCPASVLPLVLCRHSGPKPPLSLNPMLRTQSAHCQPNDCLDRPACQPVCLLHHRDMDSLRHGCDESPCLSCGKLVLQCNLPGRAAPPRLSQNVLHHPGHTPHQ